MIVLYRDASRLANKMSSNKRFIQKTLDLYYKKRATNSSDSENEANEKRSKLNDEKTSKSLSNNEANYNKSGNQETQKKIMQHDINSKTSSNINKKTIETKSTASASTPSKPPKYLSLEHIINDVNCQSYKDDKCICIKDKYPKSKHHYLIIPLNKSDQNRFFTHVNDLKRENLELLEHLKTVACKLIQTQFNDHEFDHYKCGFHTVQSMYPLHMHVITTDFVSECLKTKKHWNSFNTKYFVPLDDVIEHLKSNDTLDTLLNNDKNEIDAFLKQDLKCNQCPKILSNMPRLKEHLESHLKKKPVVVE